MIPLDNFLGDPEDYIVEFLSGVQGTMGIEYTKESFAGKCVGPISTSGADGSSTMTLSSRTC